MTQKNFEKGEIMDTNIIAARLKEALYISDLRPIDLADMTGITKGAISHYLSGRHKPSDASFEKIAQATGLNKLWLMGYDINKYEGSVEPDEEPPVRKSNEGPALTPDEKILLELYRNASEEIKFAVLQQLINGGERNS